MLARNLLRRTGDGVDQKRGFWSALAIAGLWAVHPLQVSTVLYVVQRMEMLAALFVVLSLLAYIGGRKRLQSGAPGGWWLLAAATGSTALALLSKETGVLAPFFMLAVELLFFRFVAATPKAVRFLKLGFCVVAGGSLSLYFLWMVPEFIFGDHYVKREFSWDERLLTQLRVLPMYVGWILFPAIDQYLFYYDHFPYSEGLFEPVSTLLGGLFLVALLVVAWLLRRREPIAALGIIWFFIAHALTSNIVSLELVFEHRNYLALFGVLLAIFGGARVLQLQSRRKQVLSVIAVSILFGFGLLAAIRSATWGERMNFALYHVDINPWSERAGLELALGYLGRADIRRGLPFLLQAREEMERIADLPTSGPIADRGLIILAATLDEPLPHEYWQRLIRKARDRALGRNDHDAIYDLVQQAEQGLELSEAYLWRLHQVLCDRSDIPYEIHEQFGHYANKVLDDPKRATSAFRRALELLSDEREKQKALKESLQEQGISLVENIGSCSIGAPTLPAAPSG